MLTWLLGGLLVWIALMFSPNSATLHQGTLVTQLLSFTLLAWWAISLNRLFFAAIAVVNTIWFTVVWVPAGNFPAGPWQVLPAIAATLLATLLLWVIVRAVVSPPSVSKA
jgi:hypothetical protein